MLSRTSRDLGLRETRGGQGQDGSVSAPVYNPAVLSLSMWNRDFTAAPWAGVASAGSSGSNNLDEATHPPAAGTALNGHGTALFNGSNTIVNASSHMDTYAAGDQASGWVLFKATAAFADPGANNRYTAPQFIAENANGYFGVGFCSAGIFIYTYDPSNAIMEQVIACATGAYHLLQWKYLFSAGLNLSLRLDGGAWQTTSTGFGSAISGTLSSESLSGGGKFSATSPFFTGSIAEMAMSKTALSDANFTSVLSYINSRYALSLT